MGEDFYSVSKAVQTESSIKRSKFICYINLVQTSEEAQEFIEGTRKKHWDANHNVWAWRVGYTALTERFSDDGEPAGTAGIPVLEVLRKKQMTNCVVVVNRYFGGILLGTGGLVRAYTESVLQGLNEAGAVTYCRHRQFRLQLPYELLGSVLNTLEDLEVKVETPQFSSEVIINGWVKVESIDIVEKRIAELGKGGLRLVWAGERYLPVS